MFARILKAIFGTANDRAVRRMRPLVARINELETLYRGMEPHELVRETERLKERLANALDPLAGEPEKRKRVQEDLLRQMLPDAFAMVREAGRRALGMRHYDVQLIGGIVLHEGRIAEMRTGEGKTLTATLPVFLNSLTGRGAHLITVNEYLAGRDADWMGRVYRYLGQTVGVIRHGRPTAEKRDAYLCDITYGTNTEFGFDYLRDNLKFRLDAYAQRDLSYAIVDEVDSILIDEARTPLIISGQADDSSELYVKINAVAAGLKAGVHYTVDEKAHNALLTDEGTAEVERRLHIDNLFAPQNIELLHHVNQAVKAHALYLVDREYVIEPGDDGRPRVVIVDEFTGRKQPGRRWSDGLHQAIEAKEGLDIQAEQRTLATITYQNFFRMYEKLSGMTGTADTEAEEFKKIYNLDVVVIPTHRPMIRRDEEDLVFVRGEFKWKAIVAEIERVHKTGQPILVGTASVERSEMLSAVLGRAGVPHNVLNAKNHAREADIVAQAGRLGAVTIATNMAGRGTDIVLGGNPEHLARVQVGPEAPLEEFEYVRAQFEHQAAVERRKVVELGGLFVLGTERHESRRIDNQLRGRAGRQGDPGRSVFYLSLEDDLVRIFGGERMTRLMDRLGVPDDEPIVAGIVSRSIETAQKKVEGQNFDIRKNLIEYDDVMNQQRRTIYKLRRDVLEGTGWEDRLKDALESVVYEITAGLDARAAVEDLPLDDVVQAAGARLNIDLSAELTPSNRELTDVEALRRIVYEAAEANLQRKIDLLGPELFSSFVRDIHLQIIDRLWQDHLTAMDYLRQGIGLRGYGQKDPKQEYKKEGFALFERLVQRVGDEIADFMMRVELKVETPEDKAAQAAAAAPKEEGNLTLSGGGVENTEAAPAPAAAPERGRRKKNAGPPPPPPETVRRTVTKVGPNDPCPCGSGKKFKKCHRGDPAFKQYE